MSSAGGGAASQFPVTNAIREKLTKSFHPTHLEVINESHMHNVPANSETHFKIVCVSDEFAKLKNLIQRHRLVNAALSEELQGPVHALSIVAKTPQQWESSNQEIEPSPSCRGGDGSLPPKKSS
eukprot:CAMPEP_0202481212 /NCGR_PEP_ID=MMETSP1361-20130828/886_1 /ASSEMBLY_ACC=CAM_ASM_000849 /TAXON_ID=210615 /ORGANISM="Staurosira complex sp., Strain CCMP2646" /LENGTH=123 /DNA_ID=CAMNT_0049108709 /DNA_START=228 /DNA_END=599 /DNA_ORIENTATION=+